MKRILLFSILKAMCLTTFAYDFQMDGLYYTIISETELTVEVSYTEGAKYKDDVVIPKEVTKHGNTYKVVRIGREAFLNSEMLSITIPESVDSISYDAFQNCLRIQKIYVDENNPKYKTENGVLFNKSMSILIHFPSSSEEEYTIPNSVVVIGKKAFCQCRNLRKLIMQNSVIRIEDSAFELCEVNEIVYSENLEYIGDRAFCNSGIYNPLLPASLKYIGTYAFNNCQNLTQFNIPQNVEFIGEALWGGCWKMEKISVNENNNYFCTVEGILYDKSLTTCYYCPQNFKDAEWVTLPSTLKKIATCAFHTVKSLTRIIIPAGVTEIGNSAFYYCTNISRVTCYAKTPPKTPIVEYSRSDPWEYSGRENATLYVPKGCSEAYREYYVDAPYYGYQYPYTKFKYLIEIDEETGIEDITSPHVKGDKRIYNINGFETNRIQKGLNIIHENGEVKKILIK